MADSLRRGLTVSRGWARWWLAALLAGAVGSFSIALALILKGP